MHISTLLINVGDNPDRPRPGRLWLRNAYRVHQRLCMAFPSKERKKRDAEFLQPYAPEDFAGTGAHGTARAENTGFLFRIDPVRGGNPAILVQSAVAPDWDYAFHNAGYLLAASPDVRAFDPKLSVGQRRRFRLKANPTKRAHKNTRDSSGKPIDEKWVGKRVPVPQQSQIEWLARRGKDGGFQLVDEPNVERGYVHFNKKGKGGQGQQLLSVVFEGVLAVTEPDVFLKTVQAGIGSGKAFGFGLLSVGRARA